MVRAFVLTLVLASMTLSLRAEETAAQSPVISGPIQKAIDKDKAAKVPVVLRVKLIKSASVLEKYGTDEVEVIEVLKNDTQAKLAGKIGISVRNVGPFVPKGESTIYCENGILQDSSHVVK